MIVCTEIRGWGGGAGTGQRGEDYDSAVGEVGEAGSKKALQWKPISSCLNVSFVCSFVCLDIFVFLFTSEAPPKLYVEEVVGRDLRSQHYIAYFCVHSRAILLYFSLSVL